METLAAIMFFLHICFSYLNVGSFFIFSKTCNINCKSKLLRTTVSEASILFNNKENCSVFDNPMCNPCANLAVLLGEKMLAADISLCNRNWYNGL